jgi:hypothetical protein
MTVARPFTGDDCTPGELGRTLYVLVRTDIPVAQQLVQAAHAAAEAARRYYRPSHGVASLVVLSVRGPAELLRARQRLEDLDVEHTVFFEPDGAMGDSAIGTRPLLDTERAALRGWPLWKLREHADAALPSA